MREIRTSGLTRGTRPRLVPTLLSQRFRRWIPRRGGGMPRWDDPAPDLARPRPTHFDRARRALLCLLWPGRPPARPPPDRWRRPSCRPTTTGGAFPSPRAAGGGSADAGPAGRPRVPGPRPPGAGGGGGGGVRGGDRAAGRARGRRRGARPGAGAAGDPRHRSAARLSPRRPTASRSWRSER
jgi:hypothetical protein